MFNIEYIKRALIGKNFLTLTKETPGKWNVNLIKDVLISLVYHINKPAYYHRLSFQKQQDLFFKEITKEVVKKVV